MELLKNLLSKGFILFFPKHLPCLLVEIISDWLKNATPVFQAMTSKIKTKRTFYTLFVLHFDQITCNY